MLRAGDNAPLDAAVWTTPRETATIGNLIDPAASPGGGRPILLLFYLFDWSTT